MAIGKKTKRVIEAEGVAHVSATFNNTTITITDAHGNAVSWGSSGKAGFKGSGRVSFVSCPKSGPDNAFRPPEAP